MECPACGEGVFTEYVKRPEFVCTCGCNFRPGVRERVRVRTLAKGVRRFLSDHVKQQIRDKQDDMCYWCGMSIGLQMMFKGRLLTLQPKYDHIDPFSVCMDNEDENFVMCCQKCNTWKSSIWFEDENECRKYLLKKWNKTDFVILEDNLI